MLNPEKIWHQQLVHLPTSPVYCSHFNLGNPKSHFSTALFIHPSDYLRYLRRKQTFTPNPPQLKNVTALPCKMLNFFDLTDGNVAFLQTLVALKRANCGSVGWHWNKKQFTIYIKLSLQYNKRLETVSSAEPCRCKTGSMRKTPNALNTMEQGKEGGRLR